MRWSCWASIITLAHLAACAKPPPNDAELARLVDQRIGDALAARAAVTDAGAIDSGLDASPQPKAARHYDGDKGEQPAPSASPAVRASAKLLKELDEGMLSYRPQLPDEEDFAPLLRCITSQTPNEDVALAKGADRLKARQSASAQRRRVAENRFLSEVLPLNYRLDYDWKERKSSKTAKTFLYSGTETAEPPILMKVVAAAHIEVPKTLACRVRDYGPDGDKRWRIKCSEPQNLNVVLAGKPVELHRTDEVSVPLADTPREPSGILRKEGFGYYKKYGDTWVVEGDAPALVVISAPCPTAPELLEAAEADAGAPRAD
jgi:hypothetical protein